MQAGKAWSPSAAHVITTRNLAVREYVVRRRRLGKRSCLLDGILAGLRRGHGVAAHRVGRNGAAAFALEAHVRRRQVAEVALRLRDGGEVRRRARRQVARVLPAAQVVLEVQQAPLVVEAHVVRRAGLTRQVQPQRPAHVLPPQLRHSLHRPCRRPCGMPVSCSWMLKGQHSSR